MAKYIILFSLFLVAVRGQQCRRFPVVSGLDLSQQLGNWGIHGFFGGPSYRDPTLQCYHITLTTQDLSVAPVKISAAVTGTNTTTGTAIDEGFGIEVPSLTFPGRWTAVIDGVNASVSVLHTDYIEYSLLVRCAEVEGKPEYLYLLLSRSHNQMPDSVVQGYRNFVEEELVETVSTYYKVEHSHHLCH